MLPGLSVIPRWLILCVSSTGLRDSRIAGRTLFMGLSVGESLEEISV